jgi:hypothetical protein
VGVAGIRSLRHSDIADVGGQLRYKETVYPYEIRFRNVDTGTDWQTEIPVVFYLKRPLLGTRDPLTKEDVVITSMTMQDTRVRGIYTPKSEELGPEGRALYTECEGYAHALPVLAAFLRRHGVKRVWLPDANTVVLNSGIKRHLAGMIYDKTAKRLKLGKRHEGRNLPELVDRVHHNGRYFRINTGDYAHLAEHFEAQ